MWDNVTNIKVDKIAGQQLKTIDDVIEMLRRMSVALEGLADPSGNNPVLAFNELYLRITKDVKQNIVAGTYHDSFFMEILDVEFAKLYFEALQGWVHDRIVPASWALLFQLEHDGERHSDFEGALLGVNAHINRDLTFALLNANARAGEPADWDKRHQDYDQINTIFGDRLDPIVNQLVDSLTSKSWNLIWRIVDDSLQDIDEWIMRKTIVKCRDRAWNRSRCVRSRPELEKIAATSGRTQLATILAKVVIGSHLFDHGGFSSSDDLETKQPSTDASTRQQLDAALPQAAEVLFGSDLVDMAVDGDRVAIKATSSSVDGCWEGERSQLASLFTDEWILRTVDTDSDPDIEVQQLKRGIEVVQAQTKSLTVG